MNERIQELADKSGFGPAWYDPTIPTSDIDRRWIDQRRLKEFAELIVKECMEQVWYTREDGINGNVSEVIKDRIKQHFGVEE